VACQTDLTQKEMDEKYNEVTILTSSLHQQIADLNLKVEQLQLNLESLSISEMSLKNTDTLKFYTGKAILLQLCDSDNFFFKCRDRRMVCV